LELRAEAFFGIKNYPEAVKDLQAAIALSPLRTFIRRVLSERLAEIEAYVPQMQQESPTG
jgi:hypothetical protein